MATETTDMFLEFNKDIEGETADTVKSKVKAIDILSFSFGASQPGTFHVSTGGGAGKVSVQDLSIMKYVDKASHSLLRSVCDGSSYDQAILTVRKAGGKEKVEYLVITMKKVMITSYQVSGSGGGDVRATESASLNFAEVKLEYTPQKADQTADTPLPFTWKIAEGIQG